MNQKVILGLSGGVDSAVCAHILKEQGYDVTGVYLDIGIGTPDDARAVAETAGIDFRVVDIRDALEEHVITPWCNAYLSGQTPNPCIFCNPTVKFKILFDAADAIGADFVSTGHYARIETDERGDAALLTAASEKDQSYMLHRLPKTWISRLIFPLGGFADKETVREKARAYGIPVADKGDSMEICFIPDKDYAGFLEKRGICPPEGDFVDESGNVLGRHKGIHHYTVGMRRHLGIAAGKRIYVKAIDRDHDRVILADGDDVYVSRITVRDVNLLTDLPPLPYACAAKVRYSKATNPCVIEALDGDTMTVAFDPPVRAPAPGQSAVFYCGNRVLGGGYIV